LLLAFSKFESDDCILEKAGRFYSDWNLAKSQLQLWTQDKNQPRRADGPETQKFSRDNKASVGKQVNLGRIFQILEFRGEKT